MSNKFCCGLHTWRDTCLNGGWRSSQKWVTCAPSVVQRSAAVSVVIFLWACLWGNELPTFENWYYLQKKEIEIFDYSSTRQNIYIHWYKILYLVSENLYLKNTSLCDTLSHIPYVQIWGINHCNSLNLYIDHWPMHCCLFSTYKKGIGKVPSMRNITWSASKKHDWLLHPSHPKLYGPLSTY